MSITLQDVEVILGLPIDSEILVGSIVRGGGWRTLCEELLGFEVLENDKKNFGRAKNSHQPPC